MASSPRRARRRWPAVAVGLVAVAGLLVWLAPGFIVARVLEKQLRDAGFRDARVARAGWALPDVVFDRVVLSSDETVVIEDLRARLGAGAGIERISIGRLRAEAELNADGEWLLPGLDASDDEGRLPVELVPPDGIAIDSAALRASTPVGVVDLALSGASVERSEDGETRMRLRIDDGGIAGRGFDIAGLSGDATAALLRDGSPSIDVDVSAESAEAAGIALGSLAATAGWRGGEAEFAVATPIPDIAEVRVEGRATLADTALAASLSGRVLLMAGSGAEGLVTFDAELASARSSGDPFERVEGQLRVEGSGLAYADLFSGGALTLEGDVSGSVDELRIAVGESRIELTPDPRRIPEDARALENAAASLELAGAADRPPTLLLTFAERAAELSGRVAASAGDARIAATVRAEADLGGDAAAGAPKGPRVRAEIAELVAARLPWGDLLLGADRFDGVLELGAAEWRIAGAGAFSAVGEAAAARFGGTSVEWTGAVTGDAERIVLSAKGCMPVEIDALALGEARIDDLAPLCIAPGGAGVVATYDRGEGRTAFAFTIEEQPLAARLEIDDAAYVLEGRWPKLALVGALSRSGLESLSARYSGGRVASSEAKVALAGLDGSADLRDGALAAAALRVARIETSVTPAPIVPVGLELTAERDGNALSFDAIVSDDLGTFVLEAIGRRLPARTTAHVRLHPIRFVTGATEIGDLSPLLAAHVADASGMLELEGDVEWSGGALSGSAVFKAQDFGASVAGIRIDGVSTDTRVTSLAPLVTAPEQTVAIGRVDLGMPLERGTAVFDLDSGGVLAVRDVEFEFAGGRLFAEPFTVDSVSAGDIGFVLRAEDVELSHFLALSQIDGLAGTGTLSGRVPVRLIDGRIRLDQGLLAAETEGVLRYTPNDLPDFLRGDDVRSKMLREVLTNFEYEELSIAVSGESGEGGEQRLTLNARGANPDFLEGHPIELSFNFTGPLLGAVRSAVDLSDAAELEQIFEQRDNANEENSR